MPNQNPELLDAEQFKNRLIARINVGGGGLEWLAIKSYLDNIVPNWESMRATLLYKYIQDMLKSAEEAKRFEMELVVKRTIYLVPLMVIFFSAFGYLWLVAYENIIRPVLIDWFDGEESEYFSNKGDFILIFVLAIIAYISASLSLTLSLIHGYGHRWQENWEHHIDFLQAILGIKLMRACLGGNIKNVMFSKTIVHLGYFMFIFWVVMVILFSVFLAVLSFSSQCQDPIFLGFCDTVDILVFAIASFIAMLFMLVTLYMHSAISPFLKNEKGNSIDGMIISSLPFLMYAEE